MTLTSDFVSRIFVSGAYLNHYLRQGFKIWCVNASWDGGVTVTLTVDFISRKVPGAYLFT